MADAGYKLFQTGDVLTAAQVNTYLNEQTVMVFANAAARTSALTSVLAEGMVSYLQDTNNIEVYNGSAWVGFTGDITEVQAGTGISIASGTGPIPVITNTATTTIDAEGDLLVGDAADALQRLAIGSNGNVLTVDTSVDGKIKWAAPAGGALSVSQIATGTMSGTSVTFSSLSTYDTVIVRLTGVNISADGSPNIRINSNSGANNYTNAYCSQTGSSSGGASVAATSYFITGVDDMDAGNTTNHFFIVFTNCKSSGFTNIRYQSRYANTAAATQLSWGDGLFIVAAAVTDIEFRIDGTKTFNAGTYTVWGG